MARKDKSGKGQASLDPQEMEKALRQLTGGFSAGMGTDLDRDRAQDVVYQAMEATDRSERIRMAHQALGITLDCSDAYVLLAQEDTESVEEAFFFYHKAVMAGQKAMGKKVYEESVGHFWGIFETRPYMRARLGLASCLWAMGEREEAVKHYQDMLILNPLDNQGVRYLLISCLIELGRDGDAEALYRTFEEDGTAFWTYSRVLLDFRASGDSPLAGKSLIEALKSNPYVPEYIAGRRRVPKRLPDDYGFGDRNEAIIYASENFPAWKASKGAREWLKRQVSGK